MKITAKNITEVLVKGTLVARKLLLKNHTGEVDNNIHLIFEGHFKNGSVLFKRKEFRAELLFKFHDQNQTRLIIAPYSKGGKIVIFSHEGRFYTLFQGEPSLKGEEATFPEPLYLKSDSWGREEQAQLGH
jgi:hypothetical protein